MSLHGFQFHITLALLFPLKNGLHYQLRYKWQGKPRLT